jgi:hypothetical protein
LQQQLDRLTTKEKTVIHQIATGSVTITDLQKSLDLSPADIIDVLQSIGAAYSKQTPQMLKCISDYRSCSRTFFAIDKF